jgi:hypothetical protein
LFDFTGSPIHPPLGALILKHPYSTQQVVFDNVCKLHGMPLTIVYDHDKIFTIAFW